MSSTNPTNRLIVGMPAGSLANSTRGGNLVTLLEDAGFETKGYDKGGPTEFPLASFLMGWDGRPQEFGSQLALGEVDVAIGGDDWIRERHLELKIEYGSKLELKKVLGLNRGRVRIVAIAPGDANIKSGEDFISQLAKQDLITMVSEMPYLGLNWLQNKLKSIGLGEKFSDFSVQKYKTPPKVKKGIVVYETWGKTESKVKNGGADLGVEITQSGSAIRNYGLKIVEEVMQSESAIWINPEISRQPEKLELLRMFLLNVHGAVHAENKVLLLFNTRREICDQVEEYLGKNNLFADEPSRNQGQEYIEYNIQVDIKRKDLPLVKIRYDLAKLGAKNIDTVPLSSSVPNLDILDSI